MKSILKPILFSGLAALALSGATARGVAASVIEDARPKNFVPTAQSTDALIFQGTATAYGDAEAIQEILTAKGLTHRTVSSDELSAMSLDELDQFGVIVWPGGYAGQMSKSLSPEARDNIRKAVQERGVGFVGFCAGAFVAVSPDTNWGFSVVAAETLPYYHLEDEGTSDAMTPVTFADGTERNLLWWGGPKLPEWPGGVIARYKDTQEPAIAQTWAGNGLVVLAGPHPEAPENWRAQLGLEDTDGLDQEIAFQMISAALNRQPMHSQ